MPNHIDGHAVMEYSLFLLNYHIHAGNCCCRLCSSFFSFTSSLDESLVDLVPHADNRCGDSRSDGHKLSPARASSATVAANSLVGKLVLADGYADLIVNQGHPHGNWSRLNEVYI